MYFAFARMLKKIYRLRHSVIPIMFRVVEFRVRGYQVIVAEQLCLSGAVHALLTHRLLNDASAVVEMRMGETDVIRH